EHAGPAQRRDPLEILHHLRRPVRIETPGACHPPVSRVGVLPGFSGEPGRRARSVRAVRLLPLPERTLLDLYHSRSSPEPVQIKPNEAQRRGLELAAAGGAALVQAEEGAV